MPCLPEGLYAELRNLNSLRSMNTEEMTRCQNRLNRWLSIYFPEYKTVFKDVSRFRSRAQRWAERGAGNRQERNPLGSGTALKNYNKGEFSYKAKKAPVS